MEYRHAINNRRKLKKKPNNCPSSNCCYSNFIRRNIFGLLTARDRMISIKYIIKITRNFGTVEHYEKTMIVSLFHYIIQRQKISNLDKIVKDYQENYVKEQKINKIVKIYYTWTTQSMKYIISLLT